VLHDLLHAYAAELPPDDGAEDERPPARTRLIDYYLHTAHAGTLLLAPLGHPIVLDPLPAEVTADQLTCHEEALAWFRAELHVLLAVVKLAAVVGLDAQAWQLPWTLRSFLDGQGLWQDWAAVNQIALAAAERLSDHTGMGWTHHRMAQVCSLSGEVDAGLEHNARALEHFGLVGNLSGQGSAHLGMCISLGRKGDHEAALSHGQQALELFRRAGDQIGEAYMLSCTASSATTAGSLTPGTASGRCTSGSASTSRPLPASSRRSCFPPNSGTSGDRPTASSTSATRTTRPVRWQPRARPGSRPWKCSAICNIPTPTASVPDCTTWPTSPTAWRSATAPRSSVSYANRVRNRQ
jgi:hypothetical protein